MKSQTRSKNQRANAVSRSSKVFVRTTRNGKVQKIVREVYLRRDISCLSKICSTCLRTYTTSFGEKVTPSILSADPEASKAFPSGHYIIPDTNTFLSAIDLFEVNSAFYDVIILQTVLEEVKNRSLPIYHRLLNLSSDEKKRFCVFFNEFHADTHVSRGQGESINDRNDRAIRKAAFWYQNHIREAVRIRAKHMNCPVVLMLSNDVQNVKKAKEDDIAAFSLYDYVSQLDNAYDLLDMLSSSYEQELRRASKSPKLYPEVRKLAGNEVREAYYVKHLPLSKLLTGIKAGNMHKGVFKVSQYNYLEASIQVHAFSRPLLILGREHASRAIHGDVVVVEILPKDQWKIPSMQIVEEETMNKDDNPEMEGSENIVTDKERRALQDEVRRAHEVDSEGRAQPTARVVGITKRNWRQYVGLVDESAVKKTATQVPAQQTVFLLPMDKKVPKIRIRTRRAQQIVGQRILASVDSWDRESRYPTGHLVRVLGPVESKGAETEALLLEYDVQYRPFPRSVLDCLPAEGHNWKVPSDRNNVGWTERQDYRDYLIASIDPPGCVDIDDALHARQLPNGNFEVGVHIADVSHFVNAGNAMDREASIRGTTVYLVDRRIDMLPMLLGTDLCSLKPYVDRYAFSVLWEISPEAEVIQSKFTKSVIRSREAFSYEEAQIRINDKTRTDSLTQGLRILMMLSKKLKQSRLNAGALNLASPEVRIEAESETSDPADVRTKQVLDTNSLVEEFMLLANITVAGRIYQTFTQTALLRRHAAPPKSNFEELQNQLRVRCNLELKTETSKALADSLDGCADPKEPFFNTLIRIMATRCMMSAEYFVAGTQAYSEFGHYGLASEIYTHFTSPIRRYADLVVHRQLAAAIEYERLQVGLQGKTQLEAVCRNINVRHRNAQLAGRASIEYYVGQALKGRVVEEEGFVMKVFSNGFVVFVPKFGIEGLIRLRDLGIPEPQGDFDPDKYILAVTGSREAQIVLFDKVRVKVSDELQEATGKRKIKLELV